MNARVDLITVKKLFDFEMFLTHAAVCLFRTLAVMIAIVETFNAKRKQSRQVYAQYEIKSFAVV